MVSHPLRAARPLLDRFLGFDQGAIYLGLALAAYLTDVPIVAFGFGAVSLAAFARCLQIRRGRWGRPHAQDGAAGRQNAAPSALP